MAPPITNIPVPLNKNPIMLKGCSSMTYCTRSRGLRYTGSLTCSIICLVMGCTSWYIFWALGLLSMMSNG